MDAITEKSIWQRRWSEIGLPLGLGACAAVLVVAVLAILPRITPPIALTVAVAGGMAIGWAGQQRRTGRRHVRQVDRWADALPAGFRILHDVELPGMLVEHVVIGPTGVWVIATPKGRGEVQATGQGITIDGRRLLRDPRRQVQAAAGIVRELVQRDVGGCVRVTPVVCFPNASAVGRPTGSDTVVLGWAVMLTLLRRGPQALPAATRARIQRAVLRRGPRVAQARMRLVGGATTAVSAVR